MLDIDFVRAHPEVVEANLTHRNDPNALEQFHELLLADKEWRAIKTSLDVLRCQKNVLSKKFGELKSNPKEAQSVLAEAKALPVKIKAAEQQEVQLRDRLHFLLLRIPNLLHDSVPVGKDDSENQVVRLVGKPVSNPNLIHHGQLLESLDCVDFESARKVSGSGFYFLKGPAALLDLAIQQFAISALTKKGFVPVIPPYFLHRKPYEGVTDLHDFENVMYKIEGDDLYLIATSEHSIAAMLSDQILPVADLPLLYLGISPCFRREIGRHSVDERGLFRVHQFTKVEQFVFCKPEDSWKWHEILLKNAEELVKKLDIPYRVVNVCTGDIGIVAAKKYDIEAWSPREGKFVEIISCSNCTDYQSNRLGIRCRVGSDKQPVHTLNSTAFATSRLLRVLVENYQTTQGTIKIPKVLQSYMGGLKEIKSKSKPKR